VITNEQHGGALAIRHLVNLDRRRLLFASGPLSLSAIRGRHQGATDEAATHPGVTLDMIEAPGLNIPHGRKLGKQILALGAGRYDGIVAASDLLAIGIIQSIGGVPGFAVPEDIAITGYDNNHFASESIIAMTTVSQPGEEMGRVAADLLLERIAQPDTPNRTITLEPRLIPRSSTLGKLWQRD
jgi:LacI family transcriptional regulator